MLRGKTALVTGAGLRLGRAIAEALGREGVRVVVHYNRSQGEAESLAAALRKMGTEAWTLGADLSDAQAVEGVVGRAVAVAGGLDILVNNASIFPEERLLEITAESLRENVQVNAFSALQLSRAFAAQGRSGGGHIVNLLDSRIVDYDLRHAGYHLSKQMLYSMTRMLALELAPGIAVNAVAPGLVLPPPGEDDSFLARMAHTNPLHRYGSGAEVAQAVLFLAQSEFITGQVVFVDGGRHLHASQAGV